MIVTRAMSIETVHWRGRVVYIAQWLIAIAVCLSPILLGAESVWAAILAAGGISLWFFAQRERNARAATSAAD